MKYDTLPSPEIVTKTAEALKSHNIEPIIVSSRKEALEKINELIPQGASVMNGSSRTLEEVGYIDHLKSDNHEWDNVHKGIVEEEDITKQAHLRKQALLSEYYLGSVHALTENGELVLASNTGSQLPHIVYSSHNVILVVGSQKIVPNLDAAFKRLEEHVVPLEDERMKGMYGVGTTVNKVVIFKGENPMNGRKVTVIIVKEKLGF